MYIELLEDNDYYDITIKAGKGPNVRSLTSNHELFLEQNVALFKVLYHYIYTSAVRYLK